jgi:hypothetical protein
MAATLPGLSEKNNSYGRCEPQAQESCCQGVAFKVTLLVVALLLAAAAVVVGVWGKTILPNICTATAPRVIFATLLGGVAVMLALPFILKNIKGKESQSVDLPVTPLNTVAAEEERVVRLGSQSKDIISPTSPPSNTARPYVVFSMWTDAWFANSCFHHTTDRGELVVAMVKGKKVSQAFKTYVESNKDALDPRTLFQMAKFPYHKQGSFYCFWEAPEKGDQRVFWCMGLSNCEKREGGDWECRMRKILSGRPDGFNLGLAERVRIYDEADILLCDLISP